MRRAWRPSWKVFWTRNGGTATWEVVRRCWWVRATAMAPKPSIWDISRRLRAPPRPPSDRLHRLSGARSWVLFPDLLPRFLDVLEQGLRRRAGDRLEDGGGVLRGVDQHERRRGGDLVELRLVGVLLELDLGERAVEDLGVHAGVKEEVHERGG